MKLAAPLALALCLATASAQTPQFTDPANLRGERVSPRDGRELPIDQGTRGLQQLLRKLDTRASILNIVAHPDDEDGGMLTLYSRGLGARVADLSLTRGEGGQNAVTGDFEDALGLLRTQELLANDRYTGVDQMFGTEVDFGFSKTKEEAFAKWTHERVLYDAVRAIRLYRPLVLTATFIGGVTDGHGQHQVSGQIAQEAFKAAGDPAVFPDMIAEGILPWQPLKIYARVPTQSITAQGLYDYATNQFTPARFTNYVTGEVTTTPPSADVIVHEGTPDSLLATTAAKPSDLSSAMAKQTTPLSYIQFARIGLGLQKSQIDAGFRNAPTGTFDVAYHLYGSCLPSTDTLKFCHPERSEGPASRQPAPKHSMVTSNFFDGIDTTIESIANYAPEAFPVGALANISQSIQLVLAQFNPIQPDAIAPTLATALKDLDQLITMIDAWHGDPTGKANSLHELRIKRVQLNDALALALGSVVEATTERQDLVQNQKTTVALRIIAGTDSHVASPTAVRGPEDTVIMETHIHENKDPHQPALINLILNPTVGTTASVTIPYFHRENIEQPVYQLSNESLRNAPATPPALTAWSNFKYKNTLFEVGHVVTANLQPVAVVPVLAISVRPALAMISTRDDLHPIHLTATAITNVPAVKPSIEISTPENWKGIKVPQDEATSLSKGEVAINTSILPTGITAPGAHPVTIRFFAVDPDSREHTDTDIGYRSIGYAPLPRTNLYSLAETRFVPVDLNLPTHHRLAYLPGTGDAVPEVLASIGLAPTILTVADLIPTNLAQYDTIILGVRTYNAHPDLHGAPTQALLDYAKNGGNVVVQYQTAEFTAADAPYPLSLGSNEKVVDETAPVQLLQPDSPILTLPNKITPADFNHWIEERGHGFLSTWDPHYAALTETHDPGGPETKVQEPQRGGLITTQLGKGRWTYVAFALYRQLPEAVPGAYRIFMNLIEP